MNTIPTTFGPVQVVAINPSKTGTCLRVKLQQECWLTYPPGYRPEFALQELSVAPPDAARLVRTLRKTTQTFSQEEGAKLTVGQHLPGHLQRVLQDTPRYSNQKPNYDGGYGHSVWLPERQPDLDLRTKLPA